MDQGLFAKVREGKIVDGELTERFGSSRSDYRVEAFLYCLIDRGTKTARMIPIQIVE